MSPTKSVNTPKGWIAAGSHPKYYEMSVCQADRHSGTRCARIVSTKDSIDGFGTLMQSLNASGYRDRHIKLAAYIKSDNVDDWAGLWMRVDAGKEIVAFDNMQDRPIAGSNDWKRYEIVLAVPEESTNISFGVLLSGTGTVWLDDFEFGPVSKDVEITGGSNRSCGIQYQNHKPTNLDFTQGLRPQSTDSSIDGTPVGWFTQVQNANETTIGLEGAGTAFIKCTSGTGGALLQAVLADQYVGKRLRLSADVKTDSVRSAGLFLRADAGHKLSVCYDYMDDRKLTGTLDWTNYSCVIDIPQGSDNIYLGGTLESDGTIWFKNFSMEEVSTKTKTTGKHGSATKRKKTSKPSDRRYVNATPVNLAFEDDSIASGACKTPKGWFPAGSHPQNFKMCIDPKATIDGSTRCALIETTSNDDLGFGTLMQQVDAEPFRGKRMRLSASIKTEDAGWAALWMRVDGLNGEVLGFDNMQHNPIKETTDWNCYECVLEVPPASSRIAFGVLLSGGGKTWFSKVALDEANQDVETTDIKTILTEQTRPVNLDFEDD